MVNACSIVGIRPQYIKMSKLMRLLTENGNIKHTIINTAQHYDYKMSQQFFKDLRIPDANYNLSVGSGSQAEQIAEMLVGIERILSKEKIDVTIVIGDANPTLAGAIASTKSKVPVIHIEAGLRSFSWPMAEEVNRILTDHSASILFPPTENAYNRLIAEGIRKDKIHLVGDITVDILNENMKQIEKSDILKKLALKEKNFILLTMHRAESVDDKNVLKSILEALSKFDNIVFPIHPRTKKMIKLFRLEDLIKNMLVIEPANYFDFLKLLKSCSLFVTDSGGAQKEAFILNVPCVTLREETEWVETIDAGANVIAGTETNKIKDAINQMKGKKIYYKVNPFGDGKSSERIIKIILDSFS